MAEPGENAQHFHMALHAHPFVVAEEFAEIGGDRQPRLACLLPVANQPVEGQVLVPLDIGILQQRDHVVADRAIHGILEIDDARIAGAVDPHQVARVIVAMHEDLRFRQIHGQDALEDDAQSLPFVIGENQLMVLRQKPLREQVKLPPQQRRVIVGQRAGAAGLLDFHQRGDGVGIERRGVVGVERLQVGAVAEIGKQQEAALEILRQDLRHMSSGGLEQLLHVQPGTAVFVCRRRVHHDARRAVVQRHTKIAAETGIGRGRRERETLSRPQGGQPRPDLLLAFHLQSVRQAGTGAKALSDGAIRRREVLEFAILASADNGFPGMQRA